MGFRKNSGLSVVEIMLAMVILGILMVIALPNFSRFRRMRQASGVCQQLLDDLQQEQIRAIALSEPTGIYFPETGTQFTSYYAVESDSSLTTADVGSQYPGLQFILTPSTGMQKLRFMRGGWADKTNTTITLVQDDSSCTKGCGQCECHYPVKVQVPEGSYQVWVYQSGKIVRK